MLEVGPVSGLPAPSTRRVNFKATVNPLTKTGTIIRLKEFKTNLPRRLILIAVLVVASAVSLGFAGMAQAWTAQTAEEECKGLGGSFETHIDTTSHEIVGTCTTSICTMKPVQATISYRAAGHALLSPLWGGRSASRGFDRIDRRGRHL